MDGNGNATDDTPPSPPKELLVDGTGEDPSTSRRTDELDATPAVQTPRISVTDFGSETPPRFIDIEIEKEELTVGQVEAKVEVVTPQLSQEEEVHELEIDNDNESLPPPTPAKDTVHVEVGPHPLPPSPQPERTASLSTNGHPDPRPQSPTLSTTSGSSNIAHKRTQTSFQGHHMSKVLISSALDQIASSKEAKRSAPLKESTQKATELLQAGRVGENPRDILEPLRLACETKNEKLMAVSLDCISKLIGFDFFADDDIDLPQRPSPPPSPNPNRRSSIPDGNQSIPQPSLVDLVAHTIVSCYTETTPDTVCVQIVKAILNLVVSTTTVVHHSSLLKCIRTVYNIYMLSAELRTQQVAQAALSQMVDHIFNRSGLEDEPRHSVDRRDSLAASVPDSLPGLNTAETEAPSSERSTTPTEPSKVPSPPQGPKDPGEDLDLVMYVSLQVKPLHALIRIQSVQ
jgi:brefeldin A-inhibited guanine nucleotide-exchange protein